MNKPRNPTAGIADPYWYEWSVGQSYIIDMLNPDMGIESVILQSTGVQGLDDVIVHYIDGSTECLQIKHTRNHNTITFGDLVAVDENKKSLLNSIAGAWKEAKAKWHKCCPILFTNRTSGERSATMKRSEIGEYQRPALSKFWLHLQGNIDVVKELRDIDIPQEWTEAWKEWCAQLDVLDDDAEKIEFLQSLRIETNQPNLNELTDQLIKKIALAFAITQDQARPLIGLLDHALRKWATTLRGKEAVDREKVYNQLSLPAVEMVGNHDLPPPEPFFPSRKQFADDLANALLHGT